MNIDFAKYAEQLTDFVVVFAPKLAAAILTLLIGFWLANKVERILERNLKHSNLSPELIGFFSSMLAIVVKGFVVLTAAGMVGFETASIFGLIAAAGFAIGFALQGSLSNFAAGILILLFRPFRVGDWIAAADVFGKVESIQILNTIIVSPGRKTIMIPNAEITGGVVTNYSAHGVVRLELEIPIGYEVSFPVVQTLLQEVLAKARQVLQDPAPEIGIVKYDSHNLVVAVRPYCLPDSYWEATYEVHQNIKAALHQAGIPMAYSEGVELGPIGV